MPSTKEQVYAAIAEVLEVDVANLSDDSGPEELEQWDSLSHISLVAAIEKAFSLSVPPDVAIDFDTIGDIVVWVKGKLDG